MTLPLLLLVFTLVQITRTVPLRRMILQFSQILLTLLRTFIVFTSAAVQNAANYHLYSLTPLFTRAWPASSQLATIGQDIHHAGFGNRQRVLKMSRRQPILGHDCPVIFSNTTSRRP